MLSFDADWSLMTPEIVLAAAALLIFTIDFMTGINGKKPFIGRLSIVALLATAALVLFWNGGNSGSIGDMFVVDPFSTAFKILILTGTAIVIGISMYYLDRHPDVYQGEFYSLLLFASLGAMLMVSSADLITLFIGLEILSISAYCMAGFKKYSKKSTEAAVKYVVLGGTASAFILYGMSFMYGLTGTTSLVEIGAQIGSLFDAYPFLVMMSLLFMLVGFGFKISVVPFHMWAPDVYEGAPTPVTSFLTVISKIAAFAIILRVFFTGFGGIYEEWGFIIAIVAAVTMIAGNLIALTQHNVKRLMAYSGIAQAGYLLVPIAAFVTLDMTVSVILFYAVAYMVMTLGAFAVITIVTESSGSEDILSFSGLYRRSPFLAIAMSAFLISLAGLPVSAGFTGKAWIFFQAISADMLWLAVIMIVTSIVSFFYYFGIIRQMFMKEPKEKEGQLRIPAGMSGIVTVTLIFTLGLGILPFLLINFFTTMQWMAF
ncbi:NADH-quinone oxidoreductase subunit N [Alteribacter keqinensis]|uniref:NADH-quinone oxidoreductase subunit N n=1 Tax=Alteribacter keqinensis TaxID=2483800 RepID=A0A3M7TQV1_9BACI|nr:NADH-quinone oxidoreductase subunit N [Alteribacter keqinensis]RNA67801.1 NADH-quinone oxidoreductase subunit N [Alteribacter keqinensis]